MKVVNRKTKVVFNYSEMRTYQIAVELAALYSFARSFPKGEKITKNTTTVIKKFWHSLPFELRAELLKQMTNQDIRQVLLSVEK